jgi:membrane protein insertase Oxa1/YidC/SpoIIIJ
VRTGGPISVRSALIDQVFDLAWRALTRPLFRSRAERELEPFRALEPQMKEIRRKYPGDRDARQRAMMQFYHANHLNPLAALGWNLLPDMLSPVLLTLWSRRGQSLPDRLTGTVLVIEP